jgi:hypothetical protein
MSNDVIVKVNNYNEWVTKIPNIIKKLKKWK